MTATDQAINDTTAPELDAVLERAERAAEPFGTLRPAERARHLNAVADALDAAHEELIPLAIAESNLSEGRLTGELKRTTFQLRLFAEVLVEGSYLQATIDRADPEFPLGAKPDLRRMVVPLGPVLVYAASNFPFAFSVAGGDTASALAAGCPVVLKAHPGHPRLSFRTGEIVSAALRSQGAPEGAFAVVHGFETGTAALKDDRIKAAAFTGSVSGGRALFDIANQRPNPIPFFGELGSINPAFATRAAVQSRGTELVQGYVGSYSGNAGQLCTKPGLLFLPSGHGLEAALTDATAAIAPHRMLNDRLHEGYSTRRDAVASTGGVRILSDGRIDESGASPTLVSTDVPTLLAHREALLEEAFGPLSIVVEYASPEELREAARAIDGSLTATLHAEPSDQDEIAALIPILRARAGRLLYNGWPTGVAVSPAMQHGGPYPATTDARFTSVGTASVDRFLRPVAYQNIPSELLPEPLQDGNPWSLPQQVHQG